MSAASSSGAAAAGGGGKKLSPSEVFEGFKRMRAEQQAIVGKIQELEAERGEHSVVIETLKETEPERTGFRLLNGVLVERKVGEILPALQANHESLGKALASLAAQLQTKGQALLAYKEQHNIRIQGEAAPKPADQPQPGPADAAKGDSGVLVS